MKCPICGEQLRPGKKDPNYLLCYTCKKKFKVPHSGETGVKKSTRERKSSGEKNISKKSKEQRYSNIPPKDVREKREREMKKAYEDMLSVEDEKVSKAPIIILGIAIVVVAAVIVYMLFFR